MSKITVTGQLTLTGGQLTAKETTVAPTDVNELWAWGFNGVTFPAIGDGTTVNRSSPVQIGALVDWASISNGQGHTVALKTDGSLWSWGRNQRGNLGLGNVTYYSSPVQIGDLTDWASVSAATNISFAIKTNGSLWAWGFNGNGILGLGDGVFRSSPVQVGGLTNWANIAAGPAHALALKTNGELWTWGASNNGRLGLGALVDISSPIQVGVLTTWSSVDAGSSFSLALKGDTLWAWGRNTKGYLGQGDTNDRSSPVQIGILSDWASIDAGGQHALALKANGELWSWGAAINYGQLGLEDTDNRSSPVQVGSLTDWSKISAGNTHSLALKANGSLWAWGRNLPNGYLGLGDALNRSSPVQVGALTTWTTIDTGSFFSMAIKTTT